MLVSDAVAAMIERLLNEGGGTVEVRRSELASRIGCAPSQINYVITSRFTPERGYLIESRRGGGGYIRIVRKEISRDEALMHLLYSVGDELDEGTALAMLTNLRDNGVIHPAAARIAAAAVSTAALANVPTVCRKNVRADLFRQMILAFMK